MYLLFHEEFVDGLLFSDELDNQSVQVDEQSTTKSTSNTAEKETGVSPILFFLTRHDEALCMIKVKLNGIN